MQQKPTAVSQTTLNRNAIFLLAAILLLAYVSFSPALKNGFINWDDNGYVFENAQLAKPLGESAPYFFSAHYFIGNYIPFTMLVYALEYKAAALNPHVYHGLNVLLHLVNTALVFCFIYLLSRRSLLVAGFVALFFAVHPMHVESVAWISELKDVLYTLFFISGLIAYYRYLQKQKKIFPLWALLFFVLSLLCKPAAIVFSLVLLLLDFYTQRSPGKQLWLEKLPFLVLSIIFGCVAIAAQQADRLLHHDYNLLQKCLFATHSLLAYFFKLFFPFNLSIFYPYPDVARLPSTYYFAPFVLLALVYGIYRSCKRSRLLAFGSLFFLVNLLLVLQLVSVGDAVMAERYTYVPYIGLLFVIGVWLERIYKGELPKIQISKQVLLGLMALLGLGCAYMSHGRCKVFKDDDTIASDLVAKYPNDRLALNNKGFVLYTLGRYQEATGFFMRALQLKPDYEMAYINLADAYIALNDQASAAKTVDSALVHLPNNHHLLSKKGYLLFLQQQYTQAIAYYNKALAIEHGYVSAYMGLAECYFTMKQYQPCMAMLDKGLTYEPKNYLLLNSKGYALFVQNKYDAAINCFKAALAINPSYNTAAVNLNNAMQAAAQQKP